MKFQFIIIRMEMAVMQFALVSIDIEFYIDWLVVN